MGETATQGFPEGRPRRKSRPVRRREMNEIAKHGDKRMTVKEVADVLQIPEQTLRNNIRVLFPELMQNGVTTYLNEEQVTALKLEIEQHHNLSSTGQVLRVSTRLERQLLPFLGLAAALRASSSLRKGSRDSGIGGGMTREEFEKDNGFRAAACCLFCGWITHTMLEEPCKPVIWRCRLMEEQGLSEAESAIDKPENYRCEEFEE
jgi:hypothetical protein